MNYLSVRSSIPKQAIIEFSALCVAGWVTSNEIQSVGFKYIFDTTDDEHKISFEKTSKKSFSEIIAEPLALLLGLSMLDSKIECAGEWSNEEQIQHAVSWADTRKCSCKPLSMNQPVHQLTSLTLNDLMEIYDLFEKLEGSSRMPYTSKLFAEIFPFSSLYDSTHGSLRHFRGNETYITFTENQAPITHKIDSPNPVDFHLDEWLYFLAGKKAPKTRNYFKIAPKGYFKTEVDRWKVSKMLGEVPEEHKARVYAWVDDSINTVNHFHDSRGADGPLPAMFEISFGDQTMTATQDLVFDLSD